jgi:hypothetical protein
MGVVVVPCAVAGCRTFALDSRASVPHCTTVAGAILLASKPGEGPPPVPLLCVVTSESSRGLLYRH